MDVAVVGADPCERRWKHIQAGLRGGTPEALTVKGRDACEKR
jgi:hypothetical protein